MHVHVHIIFVSLSTIPPLPYCYFQVMSRINEDEWSSGRCFSDMSTPATSTAGSTGCSGISRSVKKGFVDPSRNEDAKRTRTYHTVSVQCIPIIMMSTYSTCNLVHSVHFLSILVALISPFFSSCLLPPFIPFSSPFLSKSTPLHNPVLKDALVLPRPSSQHQVQSPLTYNVHVD